MNYTNITSCRLCKSPQITTAIVFGDIALANSYPTKNDSHEDLYPLTVMRCKDCGHIQLKETVSPQKLFSNYLYASSDSPSLVSHFKEYASDIISRVKTNEYCQVLEIGCNDGILLKEFSVLGLTNLIGVEPAKNIAEIASKNVKANIINDFFSASLGEEIAFRFGKSDIVCANNVFAHVADIDSLTQGISLALADDGIFVFENAYLLDTIKNLYFDQIYHEHLQYYGIIPLVSYFKRFGLEIFDVGYTDTQGGSFRIFVKKTSNKKLIVTENVMLAIMNEHQFKLYQSETYISFVDKISSLKSQIYQFISKAKSEGKTICCYGCPAKFALFSRVFRLDTTNVKYVVDDSPLKQGRFSPGSTIPIVSNKYFKDNPTDYCIVSVWNMADAVMRKNCDYKGQFIVPLPEFTICKSKE